MKYIKGMGVVSSDGRVLIGTGEAPTAEGIAHVYAENEALRRLVVLLSKSSKSADDAFEAADAMMEYLMLYGTPDRTGPRPTGLLKATK